MSDFRTDIKSAEAKVIAVKGKEYLQSLYSAEGLLEDPSHIQTQFRKLALLSFETGKLAGEAVSVRTVRAPAPGSFFSWQWERAAGLARDGLLTETLATPTVQPTRRLSPEQLRKLAQALSLNVPSDASLEEIEKIFFLNHLALPGVDLKSAFPGVHRGPELFGYRRAVAAAQQKQIDTFVKKHTRT